MVRILSTALLTSTLILSLGGCGAGGVQISTNSNGATLLSLSVSPADPAIAKNTDQQLTATGIYSDNTTRDVTAYVTWSSSDTTVASVDTGPDGTLASLFQGATTSKSNPGRAYAKAVGKATITATAGGTTASTTLTVTPAALVSLSIAPANPSIAKGTAKQFTATGTFSDMTTQDLTATAVWTSSIPAIAAVDSSGLTTALAAGSVIVTATSGSVSGSTTLTVTPAILVSLAVTPVNPSTAKGTALQFLATGIFSDNSTQDLTAAAVWTSSDGSIAAISNTAGSQGLATAAAAGAATISASANGFSGSTILTVTPATLGSLSVSPAIGSIAKGTKQQFNATGLYSDGSTQNLTSIVAWSSSDPTVAAISNAAGSYGLATGLATGPATITAASGNVSGSAALSVTAAVLVSLSVTPVNPSIAKGTSKQFAATGTYSDGTIQDLTAAAAWSSSNTSVATISNAAGSKGLAAAVAPGSATITAASGGLSASSTLVVTAATLSSLAVGPVNPSIAVNATQPFSAAGMYSDGSTQNLTASVTWSSSDPGVAQISNAAGSAGLATGIAAGTTAITAASGSVSGSTALTVISAPKATLTWSAPMTYTDGSPLAPAGYYLYSGPASKFYTKVADAGNVLSYTTGTLQPGSYFFSVTVYDVNGNESDYSNEVVIVIP